VQQAADRCGMASRTMLGMVRRGEVPATRDMKTRVVPTECAGETSRHSSSVTGQVRAARPSAPSRIPPRQTTPRAPAPLELGRGQSAAAPRGRLTDDYARKTVRVTVMESSLWPPQSVHASMVT
jgi:hypothetical protein